MSNFIMGVIVGAGCVGLYLYAYASGKVIETADLQCQVAILKAKTGASS